MKAATGPNGERRRHVPRWAWALIVLVLAGLVWPAWSCYARWKARHDAIQREAAAAKRLHNIAIALAAYCAQYDSCCPYLDAGRTADGWRIIGLPLVPSAGTAPAPEAAAKPSSGCPDQDLVRQLDDQEFHVRQEATRRLVALGKAALPLLENPPDGLGEEARARIAFVRAMVAPPPLPDVIAEPMWRAIHTLTAWKEHGPAYPLNDIHRAIEDLRTIGPAALPAIYRALAAEPLPDGLGNLTYVVASWGRREAAVPLMCLIDIAPPDGRRAGIAQALGAPGDRIAVPGLMALLNDEHWYVRACAAQALGHIGDARAVDALSVLALDDPHHATRRDAFDAVLATDRDAAVKLCIRVLERPKLRFFDRALEYIGEKGDSSCVQPLRKVVLDKDLPRKSRDYALGCLVNCGDERIIPILIGLLDDPEPFVRNGAARSLAITRDKSMDPHRAPADTPEAIAARKAAWEAWWAANRDSFRWPGRTHLEELYAGRMWGPSVDRCRMSIALEAPQVRRGETVRVDVLLDLEPGNPPFRFMSFDFSRFGGHYPFAPALTRPDGTAVKPARTEPDAEVLPAPVRISFFHDDVPPRRWAVLPSTKDGLLKAYDAKRRQWVYYDLPPGEYRLQIRYFSQEPPKPRCWPKEHFSNTVPLTVLGAEE